MRLTTCITTRNAPDRLETCLQAIWNSQVKPHSAVVSDDSQASEMQEINRQIVEKYPGTTYILGPQRGVNANRNCAVNSFSDTDLIAFVDDDIWIDPDFVAVALDVYTKMPPEEQQSTFITGISYAKPNSAGIPLESKPTKLSFRGYYQSTTDDPECVHIHAAVFPRKFFNEEQWEEKIFFGQGDAILCLRARSRGYRIKYCDALRALNTRPEGGTLAKKTIGELTDYDIHQIAARLYIGTKRYRDFFPNPLKLLVFWIVYFSHIHVYLLRRGAVTAWPLIMERSQIKQLLNSPRETSIAH